ncbi:hypothetical protein EYC84_001801 [Monilinia fructicola]|uniref:Uncharacterized protein n=1 Tax=Monilinia fructicola TaxID=38448 RepID=A0A5M9JVC3_MONFR|nr:hypothetical protein EYC84_001801 [Monilinia fructicola]
MAPGINLQYHVHDIPILGHFSVSNLPGQQLFATREDVLVPLCPIDVLNKCDFDTFLSRVPFPEAADSTGRGFEQECEDVDELVRF